MRSILLNNYIEWLWDSKSEVILEIKVYSQPMRDMFFILVFFPPVLMGSKLKNVNLISNKPVIFLPNNTVLLYSKRIQDLVLSVTRCVHW